MKDEETKTVVAEVRHARVRAEGDKIVLRIECHGGVRWDFTLSPGMAARLGDGFPIARHLAIHHS